MPKHSLPSFPFTVTASIDRLGGLGDGMATIHNLPAIIPHGLPGDIAEIECTSLQQGQLIGFIKNILTPSPERRTSPCAHQSTCGGCSLQQLAPLSYEKFKSRSIAEILKKCGYIENNIPTDIVFIPASTRRRAEFALLKENGSIQLAYHAPRQHQLVPITHCHLLAVPLQSWIEAHSESLQPLFALPIERMQITLADQNAIDLLFTASTDLSDNHIELISHATENLKAARISVKDPTRLIILHNHQKPTISCATTQADFSPGAFLQASKEAENAIAEAIISYVPANSRVIDLFSGIGTWSFYCADSCTINAYDNDTLSINAMRETLSANNLNHITAYTRNLFTSPLTPKELKNTDIAIINPPRAGAKAQSEQLAASHIPTIIMVSCNPATFIRDAKILKESNYKLISLKGIDQFTWSAHLEVVAVFAKQ